MFKRNALTYIILGFVFLTNIAVGFPVAGWILKIFVNVFIAFLYPRLDKANLFRILLFGNIPFYTKFGLEFLPMYWTMIPDISFFVEASGIKPVLSMEALSTALYTAKLFVLTFVFLVLLFTIPIIEYLFILFLSYFVIPKYFKHLKVVH